MGWTHCFGNNKFLFYNVRVLIQRGTCPTHNGEHYLAHENIHDDVYSRAKWTDSSRLKINKDCVLLFDHSHLGSIAGQPVI